MAVVHYQEELATSLPVLAYAYQRHIVEGDKLI